MDARRHPQSGQGHSSKGCLVQCSFTPPPYKPSTTIGTLSQTARRLKVARQTVSEWRRRYCEQGPAGLRQAGRAGRKPRLDAAQLERLESQLLQGPEAHGFPTPLWTCPRIARLIADQFGVRYHAGHVWKILRALGWSPQRRVGKARERNEGAIRGWQRTTWPRVKKKPANKAARSSSSTKAD